MSNAGKDRAPIKEEPQSVVRQRNSQENEREPEARTDRAEVPRSHPAEDEAAKEAKDRYERQRNGLMVLTLLVSSFALLVSIFSMQTAQQTLRATRRASIHVGLPDGEVGTWIAEEGKFRLVLYFRNYGPTVGRNFMVETWPIVTVSQQDFVTMTKIPPPAGIQVGPDIPPGFTYVAFVAHAEATREELDAGRKSLRIVGRIQYADPFNRYCEDFSVAYNRLRARFILAAPVSEGLCDAREDTIQTLTVITQDGTVDTIFSPYRAR